MERQYIVVSHTHWDREWYQSFDLFRMRLVDLMDHLLEILEKNPEYVFHLDAQTIILEDYLEIRPHKRDSLIQYINKGRILVGPWYVQNDFFLSLGESTIRNLMIGTKIAREFGACMKVGYCPDQFGIIGQLPQILKGFGIDSFVFGRGNNRLVCNENGVDSLRPPAEFFWEGPDRTVISTVSLPYWYNNAQRFPENIDDAMDILNRNEEQFKGLARTPYLLLMNGVDHLEAQENLLPILKKLQEKLDGGKRVVQGKIPEYIENVFTYVKQNYINLPRESGELRKGSDHSILQGTLSSRVYLKQANDLCEDILLYRLEPLYVMLKIAGIDIYPDDYLNWLWKFLIQNHAHDSICGCSQDVVHRHMEERFARICEITGTLIHRGMSVAAQHIKTPTLCNDDYRITFANTTQSPRNEVIETEVYFPKAEQVRSFSLLDGKGKPVEYTLIKKIDSAKPVYSPINLPHTVFCDQYLIRLETGMLAPYSFDGLTVRTNTGYQPFYESETDEKSIENGMLRIEVNENGVVTVTELATGRTVNDFISVIDTADMGDSYVFEKLEDDIPISSYGKLSRCKTIKDQFFSLMKLYYKLYIPARKTKNGRSKKLICHEFCLSLRLNRNSGIIEIEYYFENKADDHRTRICLNTGIETKISRSLSAFEIVDRVIGYDYVPKVRGADQPNAGLILLQNDHMSAAVYNRGLHEYEHIDENGKIALTVLRATGRIHNSSPWMTPENQCHRETSGKVFVEFGVKAGSAIKRLSVLRNPILVHYTSADRAKFSRGRDAVQETEVKEKFFREDEFSDIRIDPGRELLKVEGENIVVSALKGSEADGYILRIYNASDKMQKATLYFTGNVNPPQVLTLSEETVLNTMPIESNIVVTDLGPWHIMTLKINKTV